MRAYGYEAVNCGGRWNCACCNSFMQRTRDMGAEPGRRRSITFKAGKRLLKRAARAIAKREIEAQLTD